MVKGYINRETGTIKITESYPEETIIIRASGKTTRLVDNAIQHLFKNSNLYLLKKNAIKRSNSIVPNGSFVFIDPDHKMCNQAQQEFIYRVLKRLEAEHYSTHKIKTINRDYIHVIVKK